MAKSIVLLMCYKHKLQPLSHPYFVHSCVHSSAQVSTFTHQWTLKCLFVDLLNDPFMYSFICSVLYPFIHSSIHHSPSMRPCNHRLPAWSCRYTRGGLIEQAFYIQIANAILPELSDLLSPFTFLTSHVMARQAPSIMPQLCTFCT